MQSWIKETIALEGKKHGAINIIFCNDEYLYNINSEYLNHRYYTDIITFNQATDEQYISGDLYISVERVSENAQHFGSTFEREISRVIIHGILHLLGYGDSSEEEKSVMRSKEDQYLLKLTG